jgi:hypothetical protein
MVWTSLNLVSRGHLRLISSTYIPFDPTLNIWRWNIDIGASGRGKCWDSSSWTQGVMDLLWEVPDGHAFLFGTLSFTMEEDDDVKCLAQEQEERRTTTIVFEFYRGIKNSTTTCQAVVRQPATTNPIDSPARPPIGTPLMTTRSSEVTLSEIRTTKFEESAWSSITIRKRSIPPTSTHRSTGLQWQNMTLLHQVALHLTPEFSTVWP